MLSIHLPYCFIGIIKVVISLSSSSDLSVSCYLLGVDGAIVLDVDVLVGGQSVDLVFGERGTNLVSLCAR